MAYVDADEISSIDGFDDDTAVEIQTRARLNKMIDGKDPQAAAAELLNLLRNEAKVIA